MVSEKLVSNTTEMRNGQQIFSSYPLNILPLTSDPVIHHSLFFCYYDWWPAADDEHAIYIEYKASKPCHFTYIYINDCGDPLRWPRGTPLLPKSWH